jgi:tRNA pseudouridine55 synthase
VAKGWLFGVYCSLVNDILLIDKPKGWTSFDVVAKVRGTLRAKTGNKKIKVGHAGTLDPFATGLLLLLVGSETKNQDSYTKKDKEYLATIKLGEVSTTGDPEGEISKWPVEVVTQPSKKFILETLDKFIGKIEQVPPVYSAIKIDGQRAYALARKGKAVEMKPRSVNIDDITMLSYDFPILELRIKCSSGTYIRSLAEDIGRALNTGAYLTELKRSKIGDFDLRDARSVEATIKALQI